jgi:hypothetical protein
MRNLPPVNTPVLCHISGRNAPIVLKMIEMKWEGTSWNAWVDPDEYEMVESGATEYYNTYDPLSWAPLPEYYENLE